jgi:opacity protein-like surface antigen
MSIRATIGVLTSLALAFLIAQPASSQSSTTRGWSLGLHVQGASLTVENGDPDTGGGGGFMVGYGFNRRFTAFLNVDGSVVDAVNAPNLTGQWDMAHVDFGVRFHFANSLNRWIPYLEAAAGARAVSVDEADVDGEIQAVSFSGASFTLGGGVAYYLNETVSLDLNAKLTSGQFTDIEVGNFSVSGLDIDADSFRFGLGIVWWP